MVRWLLSAGALLAVALIAAGVFQHARSSRAHIVSGEYSMEVEVTPSQVALGDQFVARVGLFHNEPTLYEGVQWYLEFDETIVDAQLITKNGSAPPECSLKNDNGQRVLLACTTFIAAYLDYSGWTFDVVFSCIANGTSALTLEFSDLSMPFPRTYVAQDSDVYLPSHVHHDSVECSDAVPTGTPLPLTPTPTPFPGPRGGVWDLHIEGPPTGVVGQPFTTELQVFPPDDLGYVDVQWGIDHEEALLDAVLVERDPSAPPACSGQGDAGPFVVVGCHVPGINPLHLVGTAWRVSYVCLAPGMASIAVAPNQIQAPRSRVTTGGPGNFFTEQISVNTIVVNCVDPLQYNGLVKSVDGETPAEGESTILRNLWICADQATDSVDNDGNSTVDDESPTCLSNGEGELIVDELVFAEQDCDTRNDDDDGDDKPVSNDPNSPGYRPECPGPTLEDYILNWVDKDGGEMPEGLGAVEFRLLFDHKIFDIAIFESDANEDGIDNDGDTLIDEADEDWANGRFPNCGMTIVTENFITFGCVSTGTQPGHARPNGIPIARIEVRPEADLGFRIRPGKDNGVVRRLLDQNCEVADIYGDIFPVTDAGLTRDCTDVDVTVRRLEGDLDGNCEVTVVDAQRAAFRYGAFFGQLLYDTFYDLEPFVAPDFDLDIKDMQFVFGRVGATCAAPVPDNQLPVPAVGIGQP